MNYLDPDIAYISVSQEAGERLRELKVSHSENFTDLRKLIIGASSSAEEIEGFKSLHVLLKVNLASLNKCVYFACVVNEGSPAGNKSITTTIRKVLTEKQFNEMYQIQKGLTPLRLQNTVDGKDLEFLENWVHDLRLKFRKHNKDKSQQSLYSMQYRILATICDAVKLSQSALVMKD